MTALLKIVMSMGTAFMTEKFIGRVAVVLLEKLAASTKNAVDDELVKAVKAALDAKGV